MSVDPKPSRVLEICLYATDLAAAEHFYCDVLGLSVHSKAEGRHVFFKLDGEMLLIFNPQETQKPVPPGARLPVPPHGPSGPGHVCFRASANELDAWVHRLNKNSVPIEADFDWPGGGRSIYFRDTAGNCLEFAQPRIWKMT